MSRTGLVLLLLILILGCVGTVFYLIQTRQATEAYWDRVHLAEAFLESGDYENAINHLLPVTQVGSRFEGASQALYVLARLYDKTGAVEAGTIWKQLAKEYPKSEYFEEARLRWAQSLLETSPNEARAIYQEISQSPQANIREQGRLGLAQIYEQEGQTEEARKLYYQIIETAAELPVISAAKDQLSVMNTAKLWSPTLDEFSELYTVQRGDSPARIAQERKLPSYYVVEANKLTGHLRPGKQLKVPKEPFRVVVYKDICRLDLLTLSGKFVKWYPVGIGEESYKTPAGEYTIINKLLEPKWYRPNGGVVPFGHPDNALGVRWMGIGSSLGIHGTNAPETIGKHKSAGCIRMYNEDVMELYKLITIGSRVTIVDSYKTIKEGESAPTSSGAVESTTGTTQE